MMDAKILQFPERPKQPETEPEPEYDPAIRHADGSFHTWENDGFLMIRCVECGMEDSML